LSQGAGANTPAPFVFAPMPNDPIAIVRSSAAFCVDLDGVLWEGNRLLPGAIEFLEQCHAAGQPVAFLTNTVSLSRRMLAGKFRRLGIPGTEEQIFSAGRAAGLYIQSREPGARVFVLGQAGTVEEMVSCGLTPVERDAGFVMIGVDRQATFDKLKAACREGLNGAELVAANPDRWFPEEDGPVPGAGCFKAFVEWCVGRQAPVFGKPDPAIFHHALRFLGHPPERVTMIGDNAEVDLGGSHAVGMRCILVEGAHPHPGLDQPDATCRDLSALLYLRSDATRLRHV